MTKRRGIYAALGGLVLAGAAAFFLLRGPAPDGDSVEAVAGAQASPARPVEEAAAPAKSEAGPKDGERSTIQAKPEGEAAPPAPETMAPPADMVAPALEALAPAPEATAQPETPVPAPEAPAFPLEALTPAPETAPTAPAAIVPAVTAPVMISPEKGPPAVVAAVPPPLPSPAAPSPRAKPTETAPPKLAPLPETVAVRPAPAPPPARPSQDPKKMLRGIEPDGLISLTGGSFSMGDAMGLKYEKPVHQVSVSSFAISAREVSGREWAAVMGHGPGGLPSEPELAVEFITWFEAIEYCNTLSRLKGLRPAYEVDGESVRWIRQSSGYRLPTEAEWEYAARAGSGSRYSGGEIPTEVAIFRAEGPARPGMRAPNAFGLYDMSGNVAEWCWDWFAPFDTTIQANPTGPESGTERVIRGGSWYGMDRSITVSARASSHPANRQRGIGLRVVRSIFP